MGKQKGFWVRVWHFGNRLKDSDNKRLQAWGQKLRDTALEHKAA